MACQITMFSNLGGTPDAGGTWTYTGATTVDFIVDTVQGTYAPMATIGTGGSGESTTIDVSPTPNGTYTFSYMAGAAPCDASAILTIEVNDGAIDIANFSPTVCTSDMTAYNLFDIIKGGDGTGTGVDPADNDGAWSGGGTASAGYAALTGVPTDDTFTPNGLTAGSYDFIYSVDHTGGGTPGCDNCTATGTITFNVTLAADAGMNNTITLCNEA